MNWLDLLIVVLAALAGAAGYRMGLVARSISWCGLALGLYVAARLIPHVLDGHEAATGGTVAPRRGKHPRDRRAGRPGARDVRREPSPAQRFRTGSVSTFDRAAARSPGCSACSSRCGCCCPRSREVPDWPARQARTSAIARAIDGLFPTPPDAVDAIRQLVDDTSPEVFAGLKPAPDVPAPPDSIVVGVDRERPGDGRCVPRRGARVRAHPGGQRLHGRPGPHRHERARRRWVD